jgi:hypothetical protein
VISCSLFGWFGELDWMVWWIRLGVLVEPLWVVQWSRSGGLLTVGKGCSMITQQFCIRVLGGQVEQQRVCTGYIHDTFLLLPPASNQRHARR